ncbi:MAG: transketolase [Synergistaceae bacterium]|nr:transketolase [Synergistaceae bacterium]
MALTELKLTNFPFENLSPEHVKELEAAAKRARVNALTMVKLANSGHPGGAFSSIDMFLAVYGVANLNLANCNDLNRDYVVVSHGHTSAGAYAAMAEWGFFGAEEAAAHFRQIGSVFQGHVDRHVPGVDWGTGVLGQGLSAGAGFALAARANNFRNRVYVLMGDGGQTKGQLAEARRLIAHERLHNVTALIDYNSIQISGRTYDVMPCNLKALWEADGWEVIECDGHNFNELYLALKNAGKNNKPTVLLCKTLIGKNGGAMEDTPEYHGKAPSDEIYFSVIKNLGVAAPEEFLSRMKAKRNSEIKFKGREVKYFEPDLATGTPFDYDKVADNRGAFGHALADVAAINKYKQGSTPILVFDCDLMPSVMTGDFKKICQGNFIQVGIQEHNAATVSGAAASAGVVSVWADFGIFGIDEVYNNQRLNAINYAGNKTVLTHVGLDVGEDGKTHQCVDYVGLFKNMFGWKLVVPADPSQTDRVTRWMLKTPGCICLAVGRSKLKPLKLDDKLVFGSENNYEFEYGKAIKLKSGSDGAIFALGYMTAAALEAAEILNNKNNLNVAVWSVACPLEPDLDALKEACRSKFILTVEDHVADTGMGAIMALEIARNNLGAKIKNLGVTRWGDSCAADAARAAMGLTAENIAKEFCNLAK